MLKCPYCNKKIKNLYEHLCYNEKCGKAHIDKLQPQIDAIVSEYMKKTERRERKTFEY